MFRVLEMNDAALNKTLCQCYTCNSLVLSIGIAPYLVQYIIKDQLWHLITHSVSRMCGEHHEPTYIYNGDMFNVSFVTSSAGTAPGFTMSVVHKLGMCYLYY